MTSISPSAAASPVPAAPSPPDGTVPASELHQALVALVRLLARQAARDWLAHTVTTETTDVSRDVPSRNGQS